MPWRPGTQIQVSIDVSAAAMPTRGGATGTLGFNAARKFVSQATIDAYVGAGVDLRDLAGNRITTAGWHDFTARDTNADGIYDTDGVIFVDFDRPGQAGHGLVDAVVIVLTENAFGDDDPTLERIVDPFLPGAGNIAPTIATAAATFVNTTAFDVFRPVAGQFVAADADGDRITYGVVGGRVQGTFVTRSSPLGTLRVNRTTGAYTYTPARAAMNRVVGTAFDDFVLTVSDGKVSGQSTFRAAVVPAPAAAVLAEFALGSHSPSSPANVATLVPTLGQGGTPPTVSTPQHYLQFTLRGAAGEVRASDLRFFANDRLFSLRGTQLVKVAEGNGSVTYRLLGLRHVSSAKARYTFVVGGAGGGVATSWSRA